MDEFVQYFASTLQLRGQLYSHKSRGQSTPNNSRTYGQAWFTSKTTVVPRAPHVALVQNYQVAHSARTPSRAELHKSTTPFVFGSISYPSAQLEKPQVTQGRWPSQLSANNISKLPSSKVHDIQNTMEYPRSRLSSSSSISSVGPETPPMSPSEPSLGHVFDEFDFQLLDQLFHIPPQYGKDFLHPFPYSISV